MHSINMDVNTLQRINSTRLFSTARSARAEPLRAIPQVREEINHGSKNGNGHVKAEPDAFKALVELSKKQSVNRKQDVGRGSLMEIHRYLAGSPKMLCRSFAFK